MIDWEELSRGFKRRNSGPIVLIYVQNLFGRMQKVCKRNSFKRLR
jgi:hypothetical protein